MSDQYERLMVAVREYAAVVAVTGVHRAFHPSAPSLVVSTARTIVEREARILEASAKVEVLRAIVGGQCSEKLIHSDLNAAERDLDDLLKRREEG